MDFEAFLRKLISQNADFSTKVGLNQEGRVLVAIESEGINGFYIVVENTAHQLGPLVDTKPPTQRVAAAGFDAHKGMGERT